MTSGLALLPLAVVAAAAIVILLLEAFFREAVRDILGYAALAFLVACGYFSLKAWGRGYSYFGGRLGLDNLALLLTLFLVLAAVFVILMSLKYLALRGLPAAEYFALLLLALVGTMVMVSSQNLLIVFLGLEVLSVASYALAGLHPHDPKSPEASIKYFLLGSFASAVLVFGLALSYGAAGSLEIRAVAPALKGEPGTGILGLVGLAMVLAAIAFKIALVPFHMWTPDVYEGAPTPAAAFFSVGPKIAGFAVLVRLFSSLPPLNDPSRRLVWVLGAMAVLTMVVGNLAALRQTNIKRILAYSSIGHAGYMAVGIAVGDYVSVVFYLAAYLFMTLGAFAAVTAMSRKEAEFVELEDYSGIGFKYPWLGATFSIFLLSLAGFPPLAGFLGKYYIFSAAVRQGFVGLAIVGVLATLVSVYFYLRVIVFMYMREPSREVDISQENPSLFLVLFLCLYGVLQLGLNPGNVLAFIRKAVSALFPV
jgi:NADH-quinone oxidoreductase subunit N